MVEFVCITASILFKHQLHLATAPFFFRRHRGWNGLFLNLFSLPISGANIVMRSGNQYHPNTLDCENTSLFFLHNHCTHFQISTTKHCPLKDTSALNKKLWRGNHRRKFHWISSVLLSRSLVQFQIFTIFTVCSQQCPGGHLALKY